MLFWIILGVWIGLMLMLLVFTVIEVLDTTIPASKRDEYLAKWLNAPLKEPEHLDAWYRKPSGLYRQDRVAVGACEAFALDQITAEQLERAITVQVNSNAPPESNFLMPSECVDVTHETIQGWGWDASRCV